MATRSLADAQTELTAAYAARARILTTGQNVAVDGQSLSQANLATVNETIRLLEAEVERLTAESSGTPAPFRYFLAGFQ
jgi:hypothetical protein